MQRHCKANRAELMYIPRTGPVIAEIQTTIVVAELAPIYGQFAKT